MPVLPSKSPARAHAHAHTHTHTHKHTHTHILFTQRSLHPPLWPPFSLAAALHGGPHSAAGHEAQAGGEREAAGGEVVMKFECQMYKSRDDEYLIDIQKLTGDTFIFMEVMARLLVDLRI